MHDLSYSGVVSVGVNILENFQIPQRWQQQLVSFLSKPDPASDQIAQDRIVLFHILAY